MYVNFGDIKCVNRLEVFISDLILLKKNNFLIFFIRNGIEKFFLV